MCTSLRNVNNSQPSRYYNCKPNTIANTQAGIIIWSSSATGSRDSKHYNEFNEKVTINDNDKTFPSQFHSHLANLLPDVSRQLYQQQQACKDVRT